MSGEGLTLQADIQFEPTDLQWTNPCAVQVSKKRSINRESITIDATGSAGAQLQPEGFPPSTDSNNGKYIRIDPNHHLGTFVTNGVPAST